MFQPLKSLPARQPSVYLSFLIQHFFSRINITRIPRINTRILEIISDMLRLLLEFLKLTLVLLVLLIVREIVVFLGYLLGFSLVLLGFLEFLLDLYIVPIVPPILSMRILGSTLEQIDWTELSYSSSI